MFRFSPRPNRAHLVKWRPWGAEAFQEAQQQDKPVVLWLTAFWCGYCQRMDDTALSNDEVIALLNAFFIPMRVEESQRPDIDLRYNQNGWPTIAFLTPAGDDILRVNYLDPEPFISLLVRLVDAYQRDKATILETAARNRMEAQQRKADAAPAPLGASIVAEIAGMLEGLADHVHGGYGTQAKFLHTEANDFLLYLSGVSGDRTYLDHVAFTLEKMRESRTFDHKDGGFFRYSSRVDWREPHPEKLLDDQAGLLRNYLYTYLLTERDAYKETALGLIDYLNTTLTDPAQPCFWGCQDYVRPALPPPTSHPSGPLPLLSLLDQYVYCDANARAASSYLEAWWLLGRDDCRDRAEQILQHLWETLRAPTGEMYHYWDGAPHVPGLLMDTTMTGLAMLDAYALLQTTALSRTRHPAWCGYCPAASQSHRRLFRHQRDWPRQLAGAHHRADAECPRRHLLCAARRFEWPHRLPQARLLGPAELSQCAPPVRSVRRRLRPCPGAAFNSAPVHRHYRRPWRS